MGICTPYTIPPLFWYLITFNKAENHKQAFYLKINVINVKK